MKKLYIKTINITLIYILIISLSVTAKSSVNYSEVVGSGMVTATMLKDSNGIAQGEVVEVIKGEKQKSFYVRSIISGRKTWVSKNSLAISNDKNIDVEDIDKKIIEGYINDKYFKNPSKYLIWVDLLRQNTHILIYSKEGYKLYKTMPCSTGINTAPTTRGVFRITERGNWFYSSYYRQGFKYWVRFNGPYLFHSLPMDKSGKIVDYTLGKKASHGCVRLRVADAYWIYKNIPNNTIVYVN